MEESVFDTEPLSRMLLTVVMLLGLMVGFVQAADSEEEALGELGIMHGGESLSCLAVNGRGQTLNHVYYASCVETNQYGNLQNYIRDTWSWRRTAGVSHAVPASSPNTGAQSPRAGGAPCGVLGGRCCPF